MINEILCVSEDLVQVCVCVCVFFLSPTAQWTTVSK